MSKHTSFSVTRIDDEEDEDEITQRISAHLLLSQRVNSFGGYMLTPR